MGEDPRRVLSNEVFTRNGVFIIGATSITVRSRSNGRPLPEFDFLGPAPKKGRASMVSYAMALIESLATP